MNNLPLKSFIGLIFFSSCGGNNSNKRLKSEIKKVFKKIGRKKQGSYL
jgi:hypothetical protein